MQGKQRIWSHSLSPALRLCLLAAVPAGLGLLPTLGTRVPACTTLHSCHAAPERAGGTQLGRSQGEPGWAEGAGQTLPTAPLSQLQRV